MTSPIARIAATAGILSLLAAGAPPAAAGGSGDAQYAALAKTFYYAGFKESPSGATAVGVHTYDARLDDLSAAAIDAHLARERATLARLQAMDPKTLSADTALDRTLLMNSIHDDLLLTGTLAQWRHNPDTYTGIASGSVYSLIERNFAPPAMRLRDAVARERQLPRLFAQARANLTTVDSATKEIAYEDASGSIGFFAHDVPQALAGVKDAAAQAALRDSTATAVKSLTSYAKFIKAIKPQGTYAIGADAYQKRLEYEDALTMPIAQYLAVGERALAHTHAEFVATAKKIDPRETPQQVFGALQKVHPAPDHLLAKATSDLLALRAFIVTHHIVTLPADANIKVVQTPPFERAFVTAQEDPPGPLETVATQAYYNVTPADPSWPKARQAGYLAQFNDFEFPIISAHEVYPGHFVNFAIDRHLDLSLTRKLSASSEFAEGWAHYSEQMMVDEGWGNGDPRVRLAQLDEALLRECRYIAGVKLHTAGWSLKKSEALFTGQCFQTPAVALEETMRGTQDPMYGYYTLGKLMILKLRDDYKKKMGSAYTLEKFHDALLAHGDPPVPLVRPLILGSADDGKPL
ncbi:MAG TPA: DUF885 domain-containing protein [Candidatus Baltobacteraceae bacterium]|jgi:uncharacterized protein (DUF885 family)